MKCSSAGTMAQARTYSEEVAGQIDEEVKAIVDRPMPGVKRS